uniref:5'-3' exoribonuclease 2, putative n=1 Tax=Theileria annulata TaxID=5874 RepID=A0A3B0MQD9_THEAN
MGIPSFFRWLAERYPLICESQDVSTADKGDAFMLLKNPENFRDKFENLNLNLTPPDGFDNLYLDVNGIVHNCSHSVVDLCQNITCEDDIFVSIFQCIINIVNIVRPKKLLYLAVDGVAPRAKIIQQRERRFRAAMESTQQQIILDSLKDMENDEESADLNEKEEEFKFDPIQITPGTPFMERLTSRLQFFALKMINENQQWKNLKIVVSGSDVPGEGEHKIMEYIRNDKAIRHAEYEKMIRNGNKEKKGVPYVSHCVYGLDADLIVLSLATHEPYICLLREQVVFGHMKNSSKMRMMVNMNNYILLHIGILREYLVADLVEDLRLRSDLNVMDRVVDDFVFLTMFVGNDFLPHIHMANIPEGGFNHMLQIYREYLVESLGGKQNSYHSPIHNTNKINNSKDVWLTSGCGEVNFDNLIMFMNKWARYENRTVQNYLTTEVVEKTNLKNQNNNNNTKVVSFNSNRVVVNHSANVSKSKTSITVIDVKNCKIETDLSDFNAKYPNEPQTLVDYRNRYYLAKMGISNQLIKCNQGSVNSVEDVVREYLHGVQWILYYYYRGVPSWNWHLPCKYPPFVNDMLLFLKNTKRKLTMADKAQFSYPLLLSDVLHISFVKGKPITPFEQLMLVLPPQSAHFLPSVFSRLITDQESPLHQYYPLHFDVDMDNTNVPWGGITLIPLVPYSLLLQQMNKALDSNNQLNNLNSHNTNHAFGNANHSVNNTNHVAKSRNLVNNNQVSGLMNSLNQLISNNDNNNELKYMCSNMLTEEEKDRNKFGLARIYSFDSKVTKPLESPFKIFHDVKECKVLCNPFFNPSLKEPHFPNTLLLPNTSHLKTPIQHNLWFPSLNNLPHRLLSKRGVDVFNSKSRHPSLYLNVFQNLNNVTMTNVTKCTTTPYISVGYPYKHLGKLKSIHTPYLMYSDKKLSGSNPSELKETIGKIDAMLDKTGMIVGYKTGTVNLNPRILDQNNQILLNMFQKLQGAVRVPPLNVVNETRLLGLEHLCENVVVTYTVLDKNLQETKVTKQVFLPMVTFLDQPTNVSKVHVMPEDDKNKVLMKEMLTLQQELRNHELLYGKYDKPKIKAVCMMEGSMYGRVGVLETVGKTFDSVSAVFTLPNVKLTIGDTSLLDFKNFMELHQKLSEHKIKWYSFEKACHLTNLKSQVASVMFQKCLVGEFKTDVGMNLVYFDTDLQVPFCLPGYTQLSPRYHNEIDPIEMVQYSGECLELVKLYKEKFPELFDLLEHQEPTKEKKTLDINELYPNLTPEQASFKLKQITKFCDSQPFRRLKLTQGNYTCMTRNQIQLLIQHQDEYASENAAPENTMVKMVRVNHMKNLHIPAYNTTLVNFDLSNIYLGQAVVYINHNERVPLGTRGIIVGIYPNRPVIEDETNLDQSKKVNSSGSKHENENSDMTLEVVLDHDILSATDLFGRCTKMRGIFVSPTEVLYLYNQNIQNIDVYSSLYSQCDRNNSNFISYV